MALTFVEHREIKTSLKWFKSTTTKPSPSQFHFPHFSISPRLVPNCATFTKVWPVKRCSLFCWPSAGCRASVPRRWWPGAAWEWGVPSVGLWASTAGAGCGRGRGTHRGVSEPRGRTATAPLAAAAWAACRRCRSPPFGNRRCAAKK